MEDNITIEVKELTSVSLNLAEELENSIPDNCSVITVKINDVNPEDPDIGYVCIRDYICDQFMTTILFSSAGIHTDGLRSRPHVHYHFIVSRIADNIFNAYKEHSNQSVLRTRWLKKNDWDKDFFKQVTFKVHLDFHEGKPKHSTLAYPLKEGKEMPEYIREGYYIFNKKPMALKYITLLSEIGQTIRGAEHAVHLRREKCEEKSRNAYFELLKFCRDNRDKFTDFQSMRIWLDVNFIEKIPEDEVPPDPQKFKVNCQKVGTRLKIFKYSSLV